VEREGEGEEGLEGGDERRGDAEEIEGRGFLSFFYGTREASGRDERLLRQVGVTRTIDREI